MGGDDMQVEANAAQSIDREQGGWEHLKGLDEEWDLGIDEAGRGPVLGPMVYGSAFCPTNRETDPKKLGVALTAEKREDLFAKIQGCEYLGWMVTVMSAGELSGAMLQVMSAGELSGAMLQRNPYNLNAQSHDTAIALIQRAIAI
ncbi:hypothetical protein T484DRAFT_1810313, partial [Baffinella frigidus]